MLTLEDSLFGIRANDDKVRTLSKQKADKEGCSADTVACTFSSVVFDLQFQRAEKNKQCF